MLFALRENFRLEEKASILTESKFSDAFQAEREFLAGEKSNGIHKKEDSDVFWFT